MKSMDDLDRMNAIVDKTERRARVLQACWYLFLIAVYLLNMYYFLFCDSLKNGIASIMGFMCICYELIMDKLKELGKKK